MKDKIRFYGAILLFFALSSCHFFNSENGIRVEVKNLSANTINNIKVYTTDKRAIVVFNKIKPQRKVEEFLDMGNTTESDGGYMIQFTRKNGIEYKAGGGYYTNGASLDRKIIFIIKNDTVLVETPLF